MAQKATMEFKKGDGRTHYFQMVEDSWTPGGSLQFAAKPNPDNDATDAAAVIDKSFNDEHIVGISHPNYLAGYVTYELEFLPEDIVGVNYSSSENKKKYKGEFQFVPALGSPESFPGNDDYIEVIIYADIKRGTA